MYREGLSWDSFGMTASFLGPPTTTSPSPQKVSLPNVEENGRMGKRAREREKGKRKRSRSFFSLSFPLPRKDRPDMNMLSHDLLPFLSH